MANPEVTRDVFLTPLWAIVLGAYVLLLGVTGYMAFLADVKGRLGVVGFYNPAHVDNQILDFAAKNKEIQPFILETLKADSATYQKKRELASQSFNVVLGAILGFLSASATFALRQRPTSEGGAPTDEVPPNKPLQPTSGTRSSVQSKPS